MWLGRVTMGGRVRGNGKMQTITENPSNKQFATKSGKEKKPLAITFVACAQVVDSRNITFSYCLFAPD